MTHSSDEERGMRGPDSPTELTIEKADEKQEEDVARGRRIRESHGDEAHPTR